MNSETIQHCATALAITSIILGGAFFVYDYNVKHRKSLADMTPEQICAEGRVSVETEFCRDLDPK